MKGTVMKSMGLFCCIMGDDKILYSCRIRGLMRLKHTSHSNPIAVGDSVIFDVNNGEKEGVIVKVCPRYNFIERKSVKKKTYSNILAANIDQILVMATLKQPRTSSGFIDRILVAAESFRITQLLVFNKNDLLSPREKEKEKELTKLYTSIGVNVSSVSMMNDNTLSHITKKLTGKITLIVGHSGTGKSTFLNRFVPDAKQVVKKISLFSKKGTHATTYAEMFQKDKNTFVIDTPGIKEWDVVGINKWELSDYFIEMRTLRHQCKYGARCIHIHEPKCAILTAVNEKKISVHRYKSYISLIHQTDNRR